MSEAETYDLIVGGAGMAGVVVTNTCGAAGLAPNMAN